MAKSTDINYNKQVIKFIGCIILLKCILASTLEFGNDEVYYWTYALHLQWCYFDHPPLIALFIRLFTFNLTHNNELFVRLTSIIGAAINTWLVYKILSRLKNKHSGWYAALLYNACVYTTFISGFLIIPDSPQVVFWLLSVYFLIRIFVLHEKQSAGILWFGLCAGLATLCKVHGMYLWFAAGLYMLFFERKKLLDPYVYLAFLITLIIIIPIFIWNFKNNFITYNYQSSRVVVNKGIHLLSFGKEILGEILYCNPAVFIFILITFIQTVRLKLFRESRRFFWLIFFLSFPLISILWCVSLFRDTLPHWSGPAYLSLLIFTAYYCDDCFKKVYIKKWIQTSAVLVLVPIIIAWASINFLPGTLSDKKYQKLGKGDFTLDMYGWRKFKLEFQKVKASDTKYGLMDNNAAIISNKWFPAADLYYYIAFPLHMKLYAFGPMFNIHQFAWLNHLNGSLKKGSDAYYITPSNYFSAPDNALVSSFSKVDSPLVIHQYRSKVLVRDFYIYRLIDLK